MKIEKLLSHAEFVQALARSLVMDEHQAADVVQETWLTALNRPPAHESSLRSWLARVVINSARIMFRSESRRWKREQAAKAPNAGNKPDDIVSRVELRQELVQMVLKLEEPFRSAILLRFYEDLSLQKVANRLGLSRSAVRLHIIQGLELLRARLDQKYNGQRSSWVCLVASIAGMNTGNALKMKLGLWAAVLLFLSLPIFFVYDLFLNKSSPLDPGVKRASHQQIPLEEEKHIPFPSTPRVLLKPANECLELKGCVLARSNGKKVPGANVQVTLIPPRGCMKAETGTEGSFEMSLPVERRSEITHLHLRISAPGFRDLETVHPYEDEPKIPFRSYYLDKNRSFVIQIKDSLGAPVRDASIRFYKEQLTINKSSDLNGRVRITDHELNRIVGRKKPEDIRMRVTAPGKTTLYYRPHAALCETNLPSEIVLQEHNKWKGRVVDSESQDPIQGAKVSVIPSCSWKDLMDPQSSVTDAKGRFAFDIFMFTAGVQMEIFVVAKGYLPYCYRPFSDPSNPFYSKGMPNPIKLQKARTIKRLCLRDGIRALVNFKFRLVLKGGLILPIKTDGAGFFDCPVSDIDKPVNVEAPGYLSPGVLDSWALTLKPLTPIEIRVHSALGKPVARASVKILKNQSGDVMGEAETNEKGEAHLKLDALLSSQVMVRIEHAEFGPFHSQPMRFDELKQRRKPFVLKEWANLLQNIRVIDEQGAPLPGSFVEAQLYDEYGNAQKNRCASILHGPTDSQGYCDISFPPFHRGMLTVLVSTEFGFVERSDLAMAIIEGDIKAKKAITFVIDKAPLTRFTIQGVVRDEWGNGLKGVRIQVTANHNDISKSCMMETGMDGTFCLISRTGAAYDLAFPLQCVKGFEGVYEAETQKQVMAGDYLFVIMTKKIKSSPKIPCPTQER